jgi:hypothetical protein
MQWAVLIIVVFGLFLAYIIFQETRAHTYWRSLVAKGDVDAIRMLLEQEIQRWKTARVPKEVPAALWHGVQTAELVAVGADAAQLTCAAEGEYRFSGGRPQEVASPLDAGMRLAAKLAEMVLYDVPNLRLAAVRVDVYSTFHTADGLPNQRCILSTLAERADADDLDWEALRPHEVLDRFATTYHVDERGLAQPIDPGPLLEGTVPVEPKPLPAPALGSDDPRSE